ncbi:MAG: DUF362 domain-containing protein [Archaeoglobaceae archaeon]
MSQVIVAHRKHSQVEDVLEQLPLPDKQKVVLKPNLITSSPPPITTPVETVEALATYYYGAGHDVVIAEGSGWGDTLDIADELGYTRLEKYAALVDLNEDDYEVKKDPDALFLKEFEHTKTLKNCYMVSVPVLKHHSTAKVTLSMKNLLGATLGQKGRVVKKGRFHMALDECIVDINSYLQPDLAVIDGRTAGFGRELSAKPHELEKIIISTDLVAADAIGATYLQRDPLSIGHLKLAEENGLGIADPQRIEIVEEQ